MRSSEGIKKFEELEEFENFVEFENENIIDLWQPLEFNIDKNYEYISKSKIFSIVSNLIYYGIAYPILKFLLKIVYDLKIEGNIVHFYPEAALWPYCNKIRKFKNGAFDLAVRNGVPIVPIVFTFREPTGYRKLFKTKKDVTVKILKPIECEDGGNSKERVEKLKEKVSSEMKRQLVKNEER